MRPLTPVNACGNILSQANHIWSIPLGFSSSKNGWLNDPTAPGWAGNIF
jgi:hypothetical protein